MKNFSGWKKEANRANMAFADKNDPSIIKMAMVEDEQWRDMANTFSLGGLCTFPIIYFTPNQEALSRDRWQTDRPELV